LIGWVAEHARVAKTDSGNETSLNERGPDDMWRMPSKAKKRFIGRGRGSRRDQGLLFEQKFV